MKLLVTGAAGMLGTSLLPILKERDHTTLATDIRHLDGTISNLDVRDIDEMSRIAEEFRPDIMLHLAAETDLEICETQPDYAYKENFFGTQNACIVCRRLGIPIVYISTAGVFDGTKTTAYTEFDQPNPINVYGDSKYRGELIIRETLPEHYIIRAGWMIGGGERDKKFVHKMMSQIDSGCKTLHAVSDKNGTPTYAPAFSSVLERLIHTNRFGTYHLACKGTATRYDVAKKMLDILGHDDIELKPVSSDFFSKEFFAPRPKSEEMRNFVLDMMSMNDMPEWTVALETYLKTYFSDRFV